MAKWMHPAEDEVGMGAARAALRVLVVDDHEMVAEGMARILGLDPGIEVVGVVHDPTAAVEAARATAVDVAVVDFHLPGMNGAELTAELAQVRPGIKTVVVSGDAGAAAVDTALAMGASGFLSKGRAAHELIAAVKAAMAGDVVVSPDLMRQLLSARRSEEDVLTAREREVLELLARGRSNGDIAETLFLSQSTVRNHVQHIFNKLDVHSKLEAVIVAARSGLIDVPRSG